MVIEKLIDNLKQQADKEVSVMNTIFNLNSRNGFLVVLYHQNRLLYRRIKQK